MDEAEHIGAESSSALGNHTCSGPIHGLCMPPCLTALCSPYSEAHILRPSQRLLLSVYRVTLHPLSSLPGPRLASVSDLYAAYHLLHKQDGPRQFHKNHGKYGPVVRQGPNRIIFNTTTALHGMPRAL